MKKDNNMLIDDFETLKAGILSCRICEEKLGFEPHPVMWGNKGAKIIQISQAPSLTVHKTLRPFSDASGKKLREEWYQISDETFYNKDNFYITSVAHCYPGKSPNGGDRVPPKICAKQWLRKEIELVDGQLFILIGRYAADFFFPKKDFTSLIFNDNIIDGKPAYVLPHPSPLNIKWFRDNTEFMETRICKIREEVHKVLNVKEGV